MPHIRSISNLRDATEISEMCHNIAEPVRIFCGRQDYASFFN